MSDGAPRVKLQHQRFTNIYGGESNLMKNEMDAKTRELILTQLRIVVDSQIKLWETAKCIEEMVDCDFDPLPWIQHASIFVDSGLELGESDLDDFLIPTQKEARHR
jgi:hypothetical protein